MLDLQDCSFQVGYCHAKQVSVIEQRKDFVVDLEKMGLNLLFVKESLSHPLSQKGSFIFYFITTSLGHPAPSS